AGQLPQALVHVAAADRVRTPGHVNPLEQLLTWQLAAAPNLTSEQPVVDGCLVLLAALADEAQHGRAAIGSEVSVPQRREPERSVLLRVVLVADPNERRVEQRQHEGDDVIEVPVTSGAVV